MINLRQTLNLAHSLLEHCKISHALIGGFAMAVYGHHRATVDIDLLADGKAKDQIKSTFLANGFILRYESAEVLQFSGVGLVDILLANRPLSLEMLTSAISNKELGIYVLRAEDIIALKIQAYKNDPSRELRDKADIQILLKTPNLDLALVKKYSDLFDEWKTIEKMRAHP